MGKMQIPVAAALAMLLIAATVVEIEAVASPTAPPRRFPSAGPNRETVYYPQGCTCCRLSYGPIQCVDVCCKRDLSKCCK